MTASVSINASLPVVDSTRIQHLKPRVAAEDIRWRSPRRDEFWRAIPAWKDVDAKAFFDHRWQDRNAITNAEKLMAALDLDPTDAFARDLAEGLRRSPMTMRITPYIFSLVDWSRPVEDPIRRQFIPLGSQLEEDHPFLGLDTLLEQEDSPTPGLTHRYYDRVLFLTTNLCPTYCRYCTRSYAVGLDTEEVQKVKIGADASRWKRSIDYITQRHEVEDVVVSGGDTFRLRGDQLRQLGEALLRIPHVRRIRIATKGLSVQPMKILSDTEWADALTDVAKLGRRLHKDVAIHTHFNHPREVTGITEDALNLLFERAIPVRNLTVLLRGVNDSAETQTLLNRQICFLNIRPYYTYVGDLVPGTDDLRTSLSAGLAIEKVVRGSMSGHNVPTYVVDAPGGGGKRNAFSYEHYDRETGISVYTAPSVRPGVFLYGDPLHYLAPDIQRRWREPAARTEMIDSALKHARQAVS